MKINSFVINLPERADRLTRFQLEIKHLGLDPYIEAGVIDSHPLKGCGTAHVNCVLVAKEQGWDKVLIMEDDVIFPAKERTLPYFKSCFKHLPEDWDILLGGIYDYCETSPHNDYWDQVSRFCGTHFYIVNAGVYERFLTWDNTKHLDIWLSSRKDFKIFVTHRYLAIQNDGYSNIAGKITTNNIDFLDTGKLL